MSSCTTTTLDLSDAMSSSVGSWHRPGLNRWLRLPSLESGLYGLDDSIVLPMEAAHSLVVLHWSTCIGQAMTAARSWAGDLVAVEAEGLAASCLLREGTNELRATIVGSARSVSVLHPILDDGGVLRDSGTAVQRDTMRTYHVRANKCSHNNTHRLMIYSPPCSSFSFLYLTEKMPTLYHASRGRSCHAHRCGQTKSSSNQTALHQSLSLSCSHLTALRDETRIFSCAVVTWHDD